MVERSVFERFRRFTTSPESHTLEDRLGDDLHMWALGYMYAYHAYQMTLNVLTERRDFEDPFEARICSELYADRREKTLRRYLQQMGEEESADAYIADIRASYNRDAKRLAEWMLKPVGRQPRDPQDIFRHQDTY